MLPPHALKCFKVHAKPKEENIQLKLEHVLNK